MKRSMPICLFIMSCLIASPGCSSKPADNENTLAVVEEVERATEPAPDKDDHFDLGRRYYDEGDHEKAIVELTRSIEINPDKTEVYFLRGASYAETGNFADAESDMKKVLELQPDFAPAYFVLGNTCLMREDYDNAIYYLTKAIDISPDDTKFLYRRATAYHDRGLSTRSPDDFADAIADYNKIVSIAPDYRPDLVYRWRADSYNALGDYPAALADYNKALEISPGDPILFCDRGNAYLRSGEFDKAKEDYVKAIDIDPEGRAGKAAQENLRTLLRSLEQREGPSLEIDPDDVNKLNDLEQQWAMNIDKAIPFIQENNNAEAQTYIDKSRGAVDQMNEILSAKGYDPSGIDRLAAMDSLVTVYSNLNKLSAYTENPAEAAKNWKEMNGLVLETRQKLDEAEAKFHEVPPLQELCRQLRGLLDELESQLK